MGTLFDGYLIVDWSANNCAKSGKDSIWWCHLLWEAGSLVLVDEQNPTTRLAAVQQIKAILLRYKDFQQRLLLGMDFAYGYPLGLAAKVAPGESPPWLAVWRYLSEQIEDSPRNANNRFEVAAHMNRLLSGSTAPFWGCPKTKQSRYLSMRKPKGEAGELFNEFRLAEQGNPTHSVWKLSYPGAVGSQVLMGLPYLYQLRTDPELACISRVWPFETGLGPLQESDLTATNILHAEIYPSLVAVSPKPGEIKDRLQVIALAEYFADLDYKNELGRLFAGRRHVSKEERQIIEREEGWILGI
jgi:precorrin-8X/cobalt-precorrin-8 methylmutase